MTTSPVLLPDPGLLEPFNDSLKGAGFVLTDPGGKALRVAANPCGGWDDECLVGPLCPHGWSVRRAPITVSGGVVGFLVEQRAPDSPAPDLFEAVRRLLADGAQTRLDLDSTVAELVEKYELLSVLYDSAATIVSISSLEEVSQRILDEAVQTLEVEYASLMLIEESGTSLRVAAARGLRGDSGGKTSIELGEGIAGYVARQGKPLLVEDLSTHELACQATREEYRPGSLLSVPLKVKDRVLGVLNVHKTTGPPFRTGDLKLLSALADLAALSIENARTYQNAITDRLTSLYNYGYFKEQLEASLEAARKAGATLSLVMFDIDHFKNFNDKNGHELGNMVLVGVAAICLANCRQKTDRVPDLVARYGGEEFIIMLQGVPRDDAFRVAERIRRLVQDEPFEGAENQPGGRVTISLGVASFPDDALTSDALINRADEALYRAKRSGRNNVQLA